MPEVLLLKNEVEKTMALHLVVRRKTGSESNFRAKLHYFINLKFPLKNVLYQAMELWTFFFSYMFYFAFQFFCLLVPAENKDAEIKRNKDIIRCEI